MLIHRLTVSPWQANCYLVRQHDRATDCIVVDPGLLGEESVVAEIDRLGLTPVALVGTHGHIDHVGDAHKLAERYEVPLWLSEPDQPLLTRPGLALSPNSAKFLPQMLGGTDELPPVRDLVTLAEEQEIGGFRVRTMLAPGHTKGSTVLDVTAGDQRVVFTGDVLFAGTIGRTDFPGGSMTEMRESLRRIKAGFDGALTLLPGHGAETTLDAELAGNPYLQDSFLEVD
ncbi:MBL fold metallo-hydrolase [Tessaracoccus oleiagri]|uniref:Glyoxylase, beta-lactamase superfamily II n=1 Tax=Tessaracoccus oleiagri TaxID=686624 RepID=A0A1G9MA83_9ACTN|nr:MBL fold metallo-hydrolase [Tessaracoccus oleiagri]SDL71176.1 Glyoxylase, beta-lactamase superfamily II [Tessaracoccus oleiagri]